MQHSLKENLFSKTLLAISALFALNMAAYAFGWYETLYGYDKLMHTLGGVSVALLVGAFFSNRIATRMRNWLFVVALVVAVGVGWELFEYAVQFFIKGVTLARAWDSVGDVLFDMLGGVIGALFVEAAKKRYNTYKIN